MLLPSRYTQPLEPFVSDGPLLRELMQLTMKDAQGNPIQFDDWQAFLIDQVLQRDPSTGHLRFRQVLISVPRQNGKSILGCAFGLYGLLLKEQHYAYVVGVASTREQSVIVYQRVLEVIANNPALKKRFSRITDTRGISSVDGRKRYELKASKAAAVQGLPITTGIADELHIMKPNIWDALVLGTTTFPDGIVIGITTAGSDESEFLKTLYERTEAPNDRFGFYIWEAPSDDLTEQNVLLSNPAVACGRISLQSVMSDIEGMPPSEAIRYRLNRFVKSSNPWIDAELWQDTENTTIAEPDYVCIDRSPKWGYASITTAQRTDVITTTARFSKANPTEEDLFQASKRFWGSKFIMDGYSLRSLGERLRAEGQSVHLATRQDIINANQLGYANLANKRLMHTKNEALTVQALAAQKKSEGEDWRVVSKGQPIDLIIGMLLSAWLCETDTNTGIQIY